MCNINMMGASSRCSFDQDTLLYVYLVLMDERKLHHLIAASYVLCWTSCFAAGVIPL